MKDSRAIIIIGIALLCIGAASISSMQQETKTNGNITRSFTVGNNVVLYIGNGGTLRAGAGATINATGANLVGISGGSGAVDSVNGHIGVVVLDKNDIILGNVDNTSDAGKPVSTATQTALNLKWNSSAVDTDTTLAANSDSRVASQKAIKAYVDANIAAGGVSSVNSRVGAVTLAKADVGLSSVDNTADTAKPVSTAQQTALDLKAAKDPAQVDLAGGTVLTVDTNYFDTFSANRTLTFTGTATEGSHILLDATVSAVVTLTIPTSYRLGETSTTTTLILSPLNHVVRWDRVNSKWKLTDSGGPLNKLDATTAPTANEDIGDGYQVGSIWIDITNKLTYQCVDSSAAAAVWRKLSLVLGTGVETALGVNTGNTGGVQLNNGSGAGLTSLTAANIAAGALTNGMAGSTQSAADNSTKLATTAYADAAATAAAAAKIVTYALTIDALADSMNYGLGYLPASFTVTNIRAVHTGSGLSSPSVLLKVYYGSDRSSGTAVVTAGSTVTSSTTGSNVTSFDSATASGFLWVTTGSKSGTTGNFEVFVVGHY